MDIALLFKRVCRVLLGFCRYHYFKWLGSRKRDCLKTKEQQKKMMSTITQLTILQSLNSNGACCSSLLDSHSSQATKYPNSRDKVVCSGVFDVSIITTGDRSLVFVYRELTMGTFSRGCNSVKLIAKKNHDRFRHNISKTIFGKKGSWKLFNKAGSRKKNQHRLHCKSELKNRMRTYGGPFWSKLI